MPGPNLAVARGFANLKAMTTQNTPNSTEQYEAIKLGIDAHAQW